MKIDEKTQRQKACIRTIHISCEEIDACEKVIKTALRACTEEEIACLTDALKRGRVNGASAVGERCDFAGTLARIREISREDCLRELNLDEQTLKEIDFWFFQICSSSEATRQDTENNEFALVTHIWCEQVLHFEKWSHNGKINRNAVELDELEERLHRLLKHEQRAHARDTLHLV